MDDSGKAFAKVHRAVTLPAHFTVWAVSEEAAFLRGKFVWVNWDVDELKEEATRMQDNDFLTANVIGWPFTQVA